MQASTNRINYAEFEAQLKARYRELWADVQRELGVAETYGDIAGEAPDTGDQATADVAVDLGFAEVGRDVDETREIEAALQRLADRSYGVCSDCGGDIPVERLRAYPTAQRCQPCQERYEHSHLRTTGPTL